ncbi:MAG: 3-deoxy-7-phosphoheptulonate synthase [Candidatus Krumholzibacteriia bacterium]
MRIVFRPNATERQIERVEKLLQQLRCRYRRSTGPEGTIVGVVGDASLLEDRNVDRMAGVARILPYTRPYKQASREYCQETSIVRVGDLEVGGDRVVVMAGPCSVETHDGLFEVARRVKAAGASILRGGAFKPRSSPYSFQGLGREGLELLHGARSETGLAVVTEVMDTRHVELVAQFADILQIGARNVQNFDLLREVGDCGKPVLLKRGMMTTIEEYLLCAEYVLSQGNDRVILCERGIRTFDHITRNTLDICAVPVIHTISHLPIIVDPSHGTGDWRYVIPMARAAIAAGADGLMIEVHTNPAEAFSDGPQSLTPDHFDQMMREVAPMASALGKQLDLSRRSRDKGAS